MINIILLGPPGSGKGTQAEMLIKRYDLIHLSTGDIFREEIKNGTPLGLLMKDLINRGELVPDNVVLKELYRRALLHRNAKGIIFDGFPRTTKQAQMLDLLLRKKKKPISMVVYLNVPEDELFKRILIRGKLTGRMDDTEEVIKNRIRVYKEVTEPLVDYFRQQHKLIEVNGFRDIDAVTKSIAVAIDQYIETKHLK